MKRLLAALAALVLSLPAVPAHAASSKLHIITAYAGSPTAPFSSSTYDLSMNDVNLISIVSAAGSVSTVVVEHKMSSGQANWITGFTCTDVDATSNSGECTINSVPSGNTRVTVSAWTSGTIDVYLETRAK